MIYYIADMHFGHTNVLRFDNRPFSDTAQMDDTLIQNWNERASRQMIQSMCSAMRSGKTKKTVFRLWSGCRGHKHLIQGNHDRVKGKLRPYWESIEQYAEVNDENRLVILSHYPILFYAPEDEEWPEYYYERKQTLWYRNGGQITHNYLKHIKKAVRQEIFEYLDKLPVNVELTVNDRQYILTHAAPMNLYESCGWKYKSARDFAVWMRFERFPVLEGRIVIFGHTPTHHFQYDNPMAIWDAKSMAQAFQDYTGRGFYSMSSNEDYPTAAELIDYAYGRYNIHAYTIEVYSPGKSENGDISSLQVGKHHARSEVGLLLPR